MVEFSAAKDQASKLISDLWKRNQPLIEERLAVLENAARAAQSGTLAEHERAEAESVAHKFSGSLGMFGYHHGTVLARELEGELHSAAPDASRLRELSTALRNELAEPPHPDPSAI